VLGLLSNWTYSDHEVQLAPGDVLSLMECLNSRTVNGFPVPAASNPACGFLALGFPVCFMSKGFDDTCRALVHATMTTDLISDRSLPGRFDAWLERVFAKVFFVANFMRGGRQAAARVGIRASPGDYIAAAAAGILIAARMAPYAIAARIPVLCDAADRSSVRKLTKVLASYGHAGFTTDAATYRPAHLPRRPFRTEASPVSENRREQSSA
jgi:hypothetical protein